MADGDEPVPSLVLQEAKDTLPEITVTDWVPTATAAPPTIQQNDDQDPRAEEAAEIIRQVEHYFSEENLPHDAHLLGLFQEGEGTVSLNEICGFKAMRKFKPRSWVKDVIKRSTVVEVCGNGKRLRRRVPLQTVPTVTPRVNRDVQKKVAPADKPHLTKNMMKPTGFEEGADEKVTAEDLEQDSIDYPSDEAFTQRIQTAVMRFCARRTMHQDYKKVFDKYMAFGGFRGGQAQFIGGLDGKGQDELTRRERAERTQYYSIEESVLDGLDGANGTKTWSVDFESLVKAFMSSHFTTCFAWYDKEQVKLATNVIRNFHRYLLLHRVCPEYEDQINAAIKACDLAESELPRLAVVDKSLPGGFNMACSMLFNGHHSNQLAQGDWAQGTEGGSWTTEEAWAAFTTGVFAHGTPEQIKAVESAKGDAGRLREAEDFPVGLEVVSIEMPSESVKKIYQCAAAKNSFIKPMGKIRCMEWKVPNAPPVDWPSHVRYAPLNPDPSREHEFIIEQDTLKFCYPGCKFACVVKQLEIGVVWIDYLQSTYASFFTWLANEKIREYKPPGPPKEWM